MLFLYPLKILISLTYVTYTILYLGAVSKIVWAWQRCKVVGGRGLMNELINNNDVYRAAPGFARVC